MILSKSLNRFLECNQINLTLVDIGARGEIQKIWNPIKNNIKFIGFEPDQDAFNALISINKKNRNKYYNVALSEKIEEKKLFVTKDPYCSSLYEPNIEGIKIYESSNWKTKTVQNEINISCTKLDSLIDCCVDYIKIDTQGSELNILKGAEKILLDQNPIVTCETWCTEVYRNAPMINHIIDYMASLGYEIFDIETAAAWKYENSSKIISRRRKIGFEVLFVKSFAELNKNNKESIIKHSLLLDYLGFRDYALFLDSQFSLNLNAYLTKNNKIFTEYLKGKLNTVLYFLNKLNLFPSYR